MTKDVVSAILILYNALLRAKKQYYILGKGENMRQRVKANIRFKDNEIGAWRTQGEVWEVDANRGWQLTQTKHDKNFFCDYAQLPWDDEKGPRILLYNYDLYKIGGTETFLFNLCKYYKDKNIIVMYKSGKPEYIEMLHDYVNVCRDDGKTKYSCDVLIMGNYFASDIYPRVTAKQKYQMIHADYSGMREAGWPIQYSRPKDVKCICVSEVAAQGLHREFGYKSLVNYNILDKDLAGERPTVFITLSRATREKGIHRIITLSKLFKKYNKRFLWLVCGTVAEQSENEIKQQLNEIPEVMLIPPSPNNKALITMSDYLVQLSDTESFCYSAYEALIMGKPVIITDFPESVNIVEQGKNGYVIPRDETKYNEELVNKIFNEIPKEVTYKDRCNYDMWEQIFSGEEVPYGDDNPN